jgi:RNA polymerase sigma-70 factor (ECF subfamily)
MHQRNPTIPVMDEEPIGPSDHSLLLRFQRGQGDAATALYLRYAQRLQALVRAQSGVDLAGRLDEDDVVQRAAKRDVRRTTGSIDTEAGGEAASARDNLPLTVLQLTINEILERLPASHRRIVELRVEGYEVAEIAKQTGRARRSVERILQEFRDRLRAEIAID